MDEFFYMDGFARYVWSAYGVTALILVGLIAASLWRRHSLRAEEHKYAPPVPDHHTQS